MSKYTIKQRQYIEVVYNQIVVKFVGLKNKTL